MGVELSDLGSEEFVRRLRGVSPSLDSSTEARLFVFYEELRRWSRRVALVGGGMGDQVVERLFGESLSVLPMIGQGVGEIVDVGSGAGFPGVVIAAARPDLRVTLIEPRQKKWAFLRAVVDKLALSSICLNARVAAALPSEVPGSFDRVTIRALLLGEVEMAALSERLSPGGSFLIWASEDREIPSGYSIQSECSLGVGRGRILELR